MLTYGITCISGRPKEPESWWLLGDRGFEFPVLIVGQAKRWETNDLNAAYGQMDRLIANLNTSYYPLSDYRYVVEEINEP